MTAIDDLNTLLVSLPGYALLTDDMKQRALDTALVPSPARADFVAIMGTGTATFSRTDGLITLDVSPFTGAHGYSNAGDLSGAVEMPDWAEIATSGIATLPAGVTNPTFFRALIGMGNTLTLPVADSQYILPYQANNETEFFAYFTAAKPDDRPSDGTEVWPGYPGYVTTYDIYWAAMGLIGFLQAQPVIRQSSSEGTSVAVDAPNWSSLLAYYRSMSRIAAATTAGPLLTLVPIPDVPHVYPVNMRDRRGGNDNVDTDLD